MWLGGIPNGRGFFVVQAAAINAAETLDGPRKEDICTELKEKVKHIADPELRGRFEKLLMEYWMLFDDDLSRAANVDDVNINVDEEKLKKVKPISRPRGIRKEHIARVTELLAEMERQGVIERVGEKDMHKVRMVSGLVVVRKPSGDLRLCVDYRRLNEATNRDFLSVVLINEIMAMLAGKKIFSCLDMKSGYHQLALTETTSYLTCFLVGGTSPTLYRFKRLPFGLKNAPNSFNRAVADCLCGHISVGRCQVYFDDVTVSSPEPNAHLDDLRAVLESLKQRNFKLGLTKCEFAQEEIELLGFKVDGNGRRVSDKRLQFFKELREGPFQAVRDLGTLEHFVGVVEYVADFLPQKIAVMGGLYDLKSSTIASLPSKCSKARRAATPLAFAETPTCDSKEVAARAVTNVCDLLLKGTVLAHLRDEIDTETGTRWVLVGESDAARLGGIGFRLLQVPVADDGKTLLYESGELLGLFGRRYNSAEKNYTINKQELLALKEGLMHFRSMVVMRHVVLRTDHLNLCGSRLAKADLDTAQLNWLNKLADYDLEVVFINGDDNTIADAMSRILWATIEADETVEISVKKQQLLDEVHQLCGHGRRDLMMRDLKTRGFQWQGMQQDVDSFLDSCKECEAFSRTKGKAQDWSDSFIDKVAHKVGDVVFIDILDRGQDRDDILVAIDAFSRYVELVGISNTHTAEELLEATRMTMEGPIGIPRVVVADQEFDCDKFRTQMATWGVCIHFTTAGVHTGNSPVERINSEIRQVLRKLATQRRVNAVNAVAELLSEVQETLNNRVHGVTRRRPNDLVFSTSRRPPFFREKSVLPMHDCKGTLIVPPRSRDPEGSGLQPGDGAQCCKERALEPGDFVWLDIRKYKLRDRVQKDMGNWHGPYEVLNVRARRVTIRHVLYAEEHTTYVVSPNHVRRTSFAEREEAEDFASRLMEATQTWEISSICKRSGDQSLVKWKGFKTPEWCLTNSLPEYWQRNTKAAKRAVMA